MDFAYKMMKFAIFKRWKEQAIAKSQQKIAKTQGTNINSFTGEELEYCIENAEIMENCP